MAVEIKTRLRHLREELANPKVSQETMARRVGISLQWYRQLENTRETRTSYTSAKALLRAFNTERQDRDQEALTLDHLELNIV